jgi:hypothetical protein
LIEFKWFGTNNAFQFSPRLTVISDVTKC